MASHCCVFLKKGKAELHTLHITPSVIKVRPGQDVSVLCYSMNMDRRTRGPRPRLRTFDPRLPLRVSEDDNNSVRGSINRIDASFNGTIVECYSEVSDSVKSNVDDLINCSLTVPKVLSNIKLLIIL